MKLAFGIRVCRFAASAQSLKGRRAYATVDSVTWVFRPPHPPQALVPTVDFKLSEALTNNPCTTNLQTLITQYLERGGLVLEESLPYESRPSADRRVPSETGETGGLVMVAHCALDKDGKENKFCVSTGFALGVPRRAEGESLVLTCAHTLEEIRRSPILVSSDESVWRALATGTFVSSGSSASSVFTPASSVLSTLHRSDLLLLSVRGIPALRTLPISPYPAPPQTPVRAHFVVNHPPPGEEGEWQPWIGDTWAKWVKGTVLGYGDFAGREAHPGTYDALSHMLFEPLPTPGSSGGPVVDEQTGAVVGVVLGTRMDYRVEGTRGWGVPSEAMIFEMFNLPETTKSPIDR